VWLRLATERLEQLTETTSDAVIVTDRAMRVRAWNRGAEAMYGWSRQDVLERELPFVPRDRREAMQASCRRVLDDGETVTNLEDVRLTRDGRRIPVAVTLSPVRDEGGAVIGIIGISKDLSALRAVEEQRAALARLKERDAIAMDLHDDTIQALHGAVLSLAAAERSAIRDAERMRVTVRQVRHQLNSTIQDLRDYLELRGCQTSRRGLSAGLMAIARQLRLNPDIPVDVEVAEPVAALVDDAQVVDHVLAVAREATSNAVRHSQADSLAIRLFQEDGQLVMVILDNGRGLDPKAIGGSSGRGLDNMLERSGLIGARLRVISPPSGGTEVRLELPLRREPPTG
jgi:two-component system, NarL family, sensor histidine kinase DevS